MGKIRCNLTVYFEEPFWVGVFEVIENRKISAARVVFGAEPKDYELFEYVLRYYTGLHFSPAVDTVVKETAKNPKRVQREARKQTSVSGIGTKSQQAIKLQQEQGKSYSAIHTIRGVMRPAFRMAVDDDLIRKNPFDLELATVIVNDSVTREAITRDQERKFLAFIKGDKHFCRYYDGIYILLHTGLRISEFCGLTRASVDFNGHKIIVDHQLLRTSQMEYVIEDTKTESGTRMVPMTPEVEACFRKILDARAKPKIEPIIDGHSGFLFLDKNGMPMVALHWEKYFQHIVEKYNKIYNVQLPKITPPCLQTHVLLQDGKERDESQNAAIHHGPQRHQRYAEHLHPCQLRRRTGRSEAHECRLKKPRCKRDGFTPYFAPFLHFPMPQGATRCHETK